MEARKNAVPSWWKPTSELTKLVGNLAARAAVSGRETAVYERVLASLSRGEVV